MRLSNEWLTTEAGDTADGLSREGLIWQARAAIRFGWIAYLSMIPAQTHSRLSRGKPVPALAKAALRVRIMLYGAFAFIQ